VRPAGADSGDQPGPGADRDRPRGAAGPVYPALPGAADRGDRGAAAPARRCARLCPRVALRELGRRAQFLDGQLDRLDDLIGPLVTERAPGLLALHGVGPDTAALLLVAAGDHPERLRSESSWAHLCGVAPIPASSGKTAGRYRLNRGGDRQANSTLWRIVLVRMGSHPATRAYADRRGKEGLPEKEIIRCLKRYVAREVYRQLRAES
jgi:transposase